ncbi:serine/threonine protein phosphatase [Sphingomonas gei]|uniref:Serine/threonine protein phosphatase n=1 Tax=Sphingomonas gei TaxID=1395960 RepID=A0A4S1X5B4_9SPHN|nr:metallophosphoesterase family protein [Sphingomonas gei]TGX50387.1 serine/threonine protein phosphatase [Sphingomonas gei]
MLHKFLGRKRPPPSELRGAIPPGQRIYAIGDVHGRLDLLDQLLARIDTDEAQRDAAQTTLIFVGDLIDRGPESAQVVERVLQLQRVRGDVRLLVGNHEEVFLQALTGNIEALRFLARIGGRETILSYGITASEYDGFDYSELMEALIARVPTEHRVFLEGSEDMIIIGDYAFVHAGVRPNSSLSEQTTKDLRWIRGDFLTYRKPFERIIVHGHTITDEVDWNANRIGIDTGAFASGRLSALGLEGTERWLVQASLP